MGNGAALRRQCSRPSSTLQSGRSRSRLAGQSAVTPLELSLTADASRVQAGGYEFLFGVLAPASLYPNNPVSPGVSAVLKAACRHQLAHPTEEVLQNLGPGTALRPRLQDVPRGPVPVVVPSLSFSMVLRISPGPRLVHADA